jgi:hypothetical protein
MDWNFKFNKKLSNLLSWKFDKVVIDDNQVRKLEIYNYIKRSDVSKLIKFLNTKQFKYCDDSKEFNKIFNIILNQNQKYINGKWLILDDISDVKYYYYVDFVKVINNRWSNFLIKIYRNISQNKDFSKIEITYWRKKNKYNLFYGDWCNKLKWISEIINKIQKRFDLIGFNEDFSWNINIEEQIFKIISWYNDLQKNKVFNLLS